MRNGPRILLIAGLSLTLTAFAAALAFGGDLQRVDSKVTLAATNPFHGHVSAAKHACERNRTVKVYQQAYGGGGLYDSTTTDSDGKWSIPATPNGKFYAVVTKKETAKFFCRADVSPTRTFSS
jgi:hypothetical protein